MLSSVNHTVRLPRWRKLASYAAQFVTLRFCFGMWWRRAALALNGMVGFQIKTRVAVLSQPTLRHQPLIRATTPRAIHVVDTTSNDRCDKQRDSAQGSNLASYREGDHG